MSETTIETSAETQPLEGDGEGKTSESSPELDEHTQKVVDAIRADFKKERARRQQVEQQLKEATPKAAEFDKLAEASKTDLERANESVNQANAKSAAALQRLAKAEVKAALAGVVDNPDEIVEDLNLAKFVDDDGEVNTEAIKALRAKYATFASRKPAPDLSQGSAGNGGGAGPAADFASFIKTQTGR